MQIKLLFTGRNYDQAILPQALDLPDGAMLTEALTELATQLPDDKPLPPAGLLAVNRRHAGAVAAPVDCPLADGDELMVIVPVAGG